jgi:single-strand DNA-binding protein
MNKVILIGRLGQDPTVRYTTNGTAVASFSVATTERYKNKAGEKQEVTEWHNIVVFGKQAERCGEFLSKGRKVSIEGSLKTRVYTDKEGVKRKTTEIKATAVTFEDSKGVAKSEGKTETAPSTDAPAPEADETEIPF